MEERRERIKREKNQMGSHVAGAIMRARKISPGVGGSG